MDLKVVSSGKRLSPKTVSYENGFQIEFDGLTQYTFEVLSDDGTYGDSVPYLYWWDVEGNYFQQYPSGRNYLFTSSKPINFKEMKERYDRYVQSIAQ